MWTTPQTSHLPKSKGISNITDTLINYEDHSTINILAVDTMLEQAYEWLCIQREHLSHSNSVWNVPFLNQIKLKIHPDKTYLGCIRKTFNFLGIHFDELPEISKIYLESHRSKLARRYAQGVSSTCIGHHIERWTSWGKATLRCWKRNTNNMKSMEHEIN